MILRVISGFHARGLLRGLTIGAVVGVGGAGSRLALRRIRELGAFPGPALVSGHLEAAWVYVVAPIAGVLLAVVVDKLLERRIPIAAAEP